MTRLTCLTSALALAAGCASAADMAFNRVASFPVVANMAPGADAARTSSAEIVAATEDGLTLVYTDSPLGAIDLDSLVPANFAQGFRPTLPGFLSPNVAKVLVEKFGIAGIGTVDEDIKFAEHMILHIIRMHNRPKNSITIARMMNRDDLANLQYSLRKLEAAGLVVSGASPDVDAAAT